MIFYALLYVSRLQAGQVYGVPLSGTLLAKTGVFPEHRTCGEDFRKKWIEVSSVFGCYFLCLLPFYWDSNKLAIRNTGNVVSCKELVSVSTINFIIYRLRHIDRRICHNGRDFGLWPSMSHTVIKDVLSLRHLSDMTFHYFELLGSSKSFTLTRSVIYS